MTQAITGDRVTSGETQTSPVYLVKGQMAQWRYPDPQKRLTPEFARKIRDMNLSERGSADVRRGYAKYNDTVLAGPEAVVGLNETNYPSYGVQRLVCTPTKVYTDDGTTRQDITNGATWTPTQDERVQFAYLDRKVFMDDGSDQVHTWSGDATTPANIVALTGMPWTLLKGGMVVHRGLLVGLRPTEGGADEITRIRWSDINRVTMESDTTTWPGNNRTEIDEGGVPIVGGLANWGRLWVFKEDGVHSGRVIMQVGRFEYEFLEELHGFEPISKLGLIARPDFLFCPSREGIMVIRPDLSIENVTRDNQSEWRDLNEGRLQYSVAWLRQRDKQVRLLCSSDTNTSGHDLVAVWDWETGAFWFDTPTDNMNYAARAVVDNEEIDWLGSSAGWLQKGNATGATDDDGTEIEWEVDMSPNDLELPGRRKFIIAMRVWIKQKTGAQNFDVWVELDQGKQASVKSSLTGGVTQEYNTGLQYNIGLKYEGGTNLQLSIFVNRLAELVAPKFFGTDSIELVGYDVEWQPIE